MTTTDTSNTSARLRRALAGPQPSMRLNAVLGAGVHPNPSHAPILIEHCASEPDFYVRDMLTWTLTRLPVATTVPLLIAALGDQRTQARSQALHTLSKIGEPSTWDAITPELLVDPDDDVARSAWRAAVILVPVARRAELAETLSTQLGRGDRDVQLSLTRAMVTLGGDARGALDNVAARGRPPAALHAVATRRRIDDPDEGFDAALHEARRTMALGPRADR